MMDCQSSAPLAKKPRSLSSLLIEAWKNRWSDIEWGVHVKQVLPRGVSGDVYDLADCILRQSLIAMTPNRLMISYLYHSINAGIVSHGALLEAVSCHTDFSRAECLTCLLDLVLSFKEKIACAGSDGECVKLANSLVSISIWLIRCLTSCASYLNEGRLYGYTPNSTNQSLTQNPTFVNYKNALSNAERCCKMLSFICKCPFIISLIYVARFEDKDKFLLLQQVFNQLLDTEHKSNALSSSFVSNSDLADALTFFQEINRSYVAPARTASSQLQASYGTKVPTPHPSSLAFSQINPIITFNVIIYPVSEASTIAQQLAKIASFNHLALSDLYCECIRACLIGVVDAAGEKPSSTAATGDDLKWAAFTYLKMPQILKRLEEINSCPPDHPDVEKGLHRLLTYSPLLDLTDRKSNVEWFPLFLEEMHKADLISRSKVEQLSSKRQIEARRSCELGRRDAAKTAQAGCSLILKVEPTIQSILQTLDSDCSKNPEAILEFLCLMQSGRSLGLILSSLSANGKLKHFTMKLLKFNEFNKQPSSGDTTPTLAQTRGLLFDVTFLMLCQISQNYGADVITQNAETQDTFFASWCAQCLPQSGSHRCPDAILVTCDSNKVEQLLNQITSSDIDFRSNSVKWHEVCLNLPAAIKEVLLAWQHGAISTDTVKSILDNVKSKMCCLPVVVSAWLCSYITLLHDEERLKPVNILQQFILPYTCEATEKFYKERSSIMVNIIKRMMFDMLPTKSIQHGLIVKTPLAEIIEATFASVHSRSWLDLKSTYEISTLLNVGGAVWFVDSLIRQLLRWDHTYDLDRAVSLIFGFFHLNLVECSSALVSHILPSYLLSKSKQELLFQPKASALAKLSVLTIFATLSEKQMQLASQSSFSTSPLKQHSNGLGDHTIASGDSVMHSHNSLKGHNELSSLLNETPFYLNTKDETGLLKDAFIRSLADLMLLLSSVTCDPEISQRTIFPLVFIEQLLLCVQENSKVLLQFLPLETVNNFIRICPEHLTYPFVVAISDIGTSKSRKVLAKSLCQLHRVKKLSGLQYQ